MLKILLGVFLVLSVSCSNSGSGGGNGPDAKIEIGNACNSNFDCPDSTVTCQSGSCQPEIATNCKTPAACSIDGQVCIQGTCQAPPVACTSTPDNCISPQVCIAGTCQAELPTNCKTDAVCANTGTCDTTTAMCMCGANAACGAGHLCVSSGCVATAATRQVFFTSTPVTPGVDFTSLATANTLCKTAGLALTTPVSNAAAVLADSTTSAWDNIQSVGTGIPDDDVLPIVFGTSPVSGPAKKRVIYGNFTSPNTSLKNLGSNHYWTGIDSDFFTKSQGTFNYNIDKVTCKNWSSSTENGFTSGSQNWSQNGIYASISNCSTPLPILCIQVNP